MEMLSRSTSSLKLLDASSWKAGCHILIIYNGSDLLLGRIKLHISLMKNSTMNRYTNIAFLVPSFYTSVRQSHTTKTHLLNASTSDQAVRHQ